MSLLPLLNQGVNFTQILAFAEGGEGAWPVIAGTGVAQFFLGLFGGGESVTGVVIQTAEQIEKEIMAVEKELEAAIQEAVKAQYIAKISAAQDWFGGVFDLYINQKLDKPFPADQWQAQLAQLTGPNSAVQEAYDWSVQQMDTQNPKSTFDTFGMALSACGLMLNGLKLGIALDWQKLCADYEAQKKAGKNPPLPKREDLSTGKEYYYVQFTQKYDNFLQDLKPLVDAAGKAYDDRQAAIDAITGITAENAATRYKTFVDKTAYNHLGILEKDSIDAINRIFADMTKARGEWDLKDDSPPKTTGQ